MYNSTKHSKFKLKSHIILVTKYRKSVLITPMSDKIKEIVIDISNRCDSKFSLGLRMERVAELASACTSMGRRRVTSPPNTRKNETP